MPIEVQEAWVSPQRGTLFECPLWCERTASLYWIDVMEPAVHRFCFQDGASARWALPKPPGTMALTDRPDTLLVAMRSGLAWLDLAGGELRAIALSGDQLAEDRFNDGVVDREGRLWIGTMDRTVQRPIGRLFRIDGSFRSTAVPAHVVLSNGLCFSPQGTRLYLSKSFEREIHAFDVAQPDGRLGEGRLLARLDEAPGGPDGSTIGADGTLWSARIGGGRIDHYTAGGELIEWLPVGAGHPTHCTFGGQDGSTLYVTTSRHGQDGSAGEHDGRVLAYRLTHRGLAPWRFKTSADQ